MGCIYGEQKRLSASLFCYLHLCFFGYLRLFFSSASCFTRFPGTCHDSGGSVGCLRLFVGAYLRLFQVAASFRVILQSFSEFYISF